MLDTLTMSLPCDTLPEANLLQLPSLLTDIKETYNYHTGNTSLYGRADNLYVGLNSHAVTISGSITKYRYGNNWERLSFGEMLRTFESLSDRLNIPIGEAVITRLDLGVNLVMKYHESLYYGLLDHCPRYKKLVQDNGIYFNQAQKQIVFYGKGGEQKDKGQPIPALYQNKHTLRYEMRWKKGLTKQFNTGKLNVQALCREPFYMGLVARMREAYTNVKKSKINPLAIENMRSYKALTEYLILKGLEAEFGSIGNAFACIDKAKKSGIFDNKMQPGRLKRKLNELYENPELNQENDLVIEMDTKVRDALKYC
jgi:hypothetical protein